jgi:hypothetical protein
MDFTMKTFFGDYENRFNQALNDPTDVDVEATAGAFTECFIEANPNGVACGRNDEEFRAQIPKGYAFYKSIGTRSMKIVSLVATQFDDFHSHVRVHWQALYDKKDGSEESIDFDVIYLIQMRGKEPRIFGYITGDEKNVLREKGLI